ncbi:hypothetical protein A3K64_02670 [Candidatus Micrarchaeota archaeon RBG_16_36_9]|nr:MAG: hypothetical protein A3K64_02670 [Candidatus Micrarchaeota archaeon RBG_16_36_9]
MVMKGFVYLLEISIALILMIAVIGTISSFKSKENWERSDLIGLGDNMMRVLDNKDFSEILKGNLTKISSIKPPNIDFGIKISGIPKDNITVGCIQPFCGYVNLLFTPTYLNNRWVNFSVEEATGDPEWIMSYFDAVALVNNTTYSDPYIKEYLKRGKTIIGINATYSNNNADFNGIFGLTPTSSGGGNFNFTTYNPLEDETQKYFFAIGFDINTSNTIDSKKWGNWYIWGIPRKVNITSNMVDVENKTSDEGFLRNIPEGGFFNIKNTTDNKFYTFKVKKIFWDKFVIIQPMNISFAFNDFSDANDVIGKFNIITSSTGQAEMTSNNTAIWISDFPPSEEYKTLIKAAVLSRVKEWYIKEPDLTKEYVAVSSFYSLCCDIPETAQMTLYLWYKI